VVSLLRAEGCEKESKFGLVAPEDGRPAETEAMILLLTPDGALVVDVARGLDSGSMVGQAHRILMQAPCGVGYHRKALYGRVRLRYLASAFARRCVVGRPAGAPALVCVCVRETSRTSSRWLVSLLRERDVAVREFEFAPSSRRVRAEFAPAPCK